jgi:hypothetical protein
LAVPSTFRGWRNDRVNNRLAVTFAGTDVAYFDANGLASGVAKTSLPTGFSKVTLVNGGAAGNHTVTGITAADEIVFVAHISTAASVATIADLTSEFTAGAGVINNAAGTDTTNDQLMVFWVDHT